MDQQTPWQRLAEPFPFEEIEIMPQMVSIEKGKAKATPYINARAAQARMDESFGPDCWGFELREAHFGDKSGFVGRLTVLVDGRPVVRESVCELSDIEPLKGADSGAFKRCFSALGHRCLYKVELGWQACTFYQSKSGQKFDDWTAHAKGSMKTSYLRQVGISQGGGSAKEAAATISTPPSAAVSNSLNLAAVPAVPSKGGNAFGHIPRTWPTAGMFAKPMEDPQVMAALREEAKRGIALGSVDKLRTMILLGYGLDLKAEVRENLTIEASKGAQALYVDWLQNSSAEHLQLALVDLMHEQARVSA